MDYSSSSSYDEPVRKHVSLKGARMPTRSVGSSFIRSPNNHVSHYWELLYHWIHEGNNRQTVMHACSTFDANEDGLLHIDLVNSAFEKAHCTLTSADLKIIYSALPELTVIHPTLGISLKYLDFLNYAYTIEHFSSL